MDDLFTTDFSVLGDFAQTVSDTPGQTTRSTGRRQVAGVRYGWKWSQQVRDLHREITLALALDPAWRQRISEANRASWADPAKREARLAGLQRYAASPASEHRKQQSKLAQMRRHGLSTDYPSVVTPAGVFWTWGEAEKAMGMYSAKRLKLQKQHPDLYYVKREAAK